MLTVSMLLLSDMFGLVPNTKVSELQSRKVIAESLAIQLASHFLDGQMKAAEQVIRSVVERNENILSAAVRKGTDGHVLKYGGHNEHWSLKPDEESTTDQLQVPLYRGGDRWGTVELRFVDLDDSEGSSTVKNSFITVILFVGFAGFCAYLVFLKRVMRELHPDQVIPPRVRRALDTLAEGLLIVDGKDNIIFSNAAFSRKTGFSEQQLVGRKSSELEWEAADGDSWEGEVPWLCVLDGEELSNVNRIKLKTALRDTFTFDFNASPIDSGAGKKIQGALITFDDVTEVEIKNQQLHRTLEKLEQTQLEISRQNQQLQLLATRDSLTGLLNRRAFFEGFRALFVEAKQEDEELSFIMLDIDHFKLVNDQYGHAVGDKVIKFLANILTESSRPIDLVGRFGGEEFCIVLPGIGIKIAAEIAERLRLLVEKGHGVKFTSGMQISSSFGVSCLADGAHDLNGLLEQADKALYAAKRGGRNRVVCWASDLQEDVAEGVSRPEKGEQALKDTEEQTYTIEENNSEAFDQALISVDESRGVKKGDAIQVQDNDLNHARDTRLDLEETTGMPSRILVMDRIGQAIKRAKRDDDRVIVMFIGIDTRQTVSDALGLSADNKLGRTVATRLNQTFRNTDSLTLAAEEEDLSFSIMNLDGNGFIVLLTDLKQIELVTRVNKRIFSALNEPVVIEGNDLLLNVSIGVSAFPFDGEDVDTLIQKASGAMREAKQDTGRNNIRFYSDDINRRAMKQMKLESELYRAVERKELILHYQPKVDLKTGQIAGMEALVRWQHPHMGLVPPDEFIPAAEQTGMIEVISDWVMRKVFRQVRLWQEAGYADVNVAINLSPVEFSKPERGERIVALMSALGVSTSAVELEITEQCVMQNMDTAVDMLEKLSNAGLSITLDDFGTGYSSLSYLKRFPVRKVKIDRSFIKDFLHKQNDAAIVSAIIAMSHSLGIRVVAEGVETEEQLRFLQDLQCDEIQGYLVGKPVPREEASDVLGQFSSIQRKIKEYGISSTGLAATRGGVPAASMMGILNECPTTITETFWEHEDSHVAEN